MPQWAKISKKYSFRKVALFPSTLDCLHKGDYGVKEKFQKNMILAFDRTVQLLLYTFFIALFFQV